MNYKMKKILYTLIICLFSASALLAQMPQNRIQSTIIADALAQLPAETPDRYNQVMTDLVSTGEAGLLDLIGSLNPPGNKSNETVDYAISGWTNFVANDAAKRAVAAGAYQKALRQSLDDEIKATIIRQLEKIGADDNVAALSNLLSDSRLSGPASQALVSIGTGNANSALLSALQNSASEQTRMNMINALAQTGYAQAESALLDVLAKNPSPAMRKVLYNALGTTGSARSLKALKDAAEKSGYSYQKENATPAYLNLLTRLASSEPKTVEKEANSLLKNATKFNLQDVKIAATKLLLSLPSTNKTNILKAALKDGNIDYLTSVLSAYPYQNDAKTTALVLKELTDKTSPEKLMALLYWLGNQNVSHSLPLFIRYSTSPNEMVQHAAISSLAKAGTEESMLALAGLLKSDNENTIALAKDALSTHKGDISYTLASVFNDATDAGKTAILQLIADRKMESQYNLVYNQMFQNNDVIKTEAAKTLQYVATDKNLADLFSLLERSDAAYTTSIQNAINAGLSYLPANEQLALVTSRMNASSNKYLYYSALSNSGSQQAMGAITNAYSTETERNKEAAFNALAGWKSFDAIYPLLDFARKSADNAEKSKIVDALISTISRSAKTGAVKSMYLEEAMQFAQTDAQKTAILSQMGNTNSYQSLLFIEPYLDNPAFSEIAAQAAMNIALSNPSFAGAKTAALLNKVSKTLNNPDAGYQRESIAKFLAENPTEGGFVSMFNGKNLDGWKGLVENPIKRAAMSARELAAAQIKADKQIALDWKVEDEMIVFDGKGYDNLCTEKQYGDFEMLVDWKLYPGPEPDAGIYLRGTPQVQIWDTARVNVGAQVGSGGLYNNQVNPSKPMKVADQKVGEWNRFHIKMIGDRVSVWLNDELVTDNVILENFWDRTKPIFPAEQIELQAHGSKVAYRNLFIKEISRPEPFELSSQEKKDGFKVLFDGTNMHQWTGNTADYVLENGAIVLYPNQAHGGNLYTKDQFDNFIFRFEFMLTQGANNGLGIRTPMEGDAAYEGMELQILDNEAPIYENLEEYQYHGSVYGVIPAKRGFLKPTGEWNYQEVIADGDNIKIILNGATILDGNIREASKNGTVDGKDHPGLLNKTGHIGFLGHGSKVKFRNIRIKEL